MDKTVRLWHVSRSECLCAFQHLDFVTSIAFHPKDDRSVLERICFTSAAGQCSFGICFSSFFLSGSLDCKLRLWNVSGHSRDGIRPTEADLHAPMQIPEKRVHVSCRRRSATLSSKSDLSSECARFGPNFPNLSPAWLSPETANTPSRAVSSVSS